MLAGLKVQHAYCCLPDNYLAEVRVWAGEGLAQLTTAVSFRSWGLELLRVILPHSKVCSSHAIPQDRGQSSELTVPTREATSCSPGSLESELQTPLRTQILLLLIPSNAFYCAVLWLKHFNCISSLSVQQLSKFRSYSKHSFNRCGHRP